ncbi:MAG: dTDP-4-dehydrorhamnose 3,5-epimerase [Chloroflexi bacterium]|nr:dTDP-4-dehydrorhamnose 3,5-epimerase [Chloroflexota bacterium]
MPFQFTRLAIPEVILVEAKAFGDKRGLFKELFQQDAFSKNGFNLPFVQDNYSRSVKGVLRGLHYQKKPYEQGKLVYAMEGEVFDVAVDIRKGSPTFGKWVGETLSEDNHRMLYVPPGFAHGFCVLSDIGAIMYKVTSLYAPKSECGIIWNDPSIGVEWPIADPILSARDVELPLLENADNNFVFNG